MNKNVVILRVPILGLLIGMLLLVIPVQAEIFKCTNKKGGVYYNAKPCPVESDEKKIQNEKDPVNGYVPPAFVNTDERKGENISVGSKQFSDGGKKPKEKLKNKNKTRDNRDNSEQNSSKSDATTSHSNDLVSKYEKYGKNSASKIDYSAVENGSGDGDDQVRKKVEPRVLTSQERRNMLNIRYHHE